jgi:hypothetical protein
MPEPDLAAGPAADALGDRRAAVLLERGRVYPSKKTHESPKLARHHHPQQRRYLGS